MKFTRHFEPSHRVLEVNGIPPIEDGTRFCGQPWCKGDCGMAKLIIPETPYPRIASAMMGIEGVFANSLLDDWTGPVVELPEEFRETAWRRFWM